MPVDLVAAGRPLHPRPRRRGPPPREARSARGPLPGGASGENAGTRFSTCFPPLCRRGAGLLFGAPTAGSLWFGWGFSAPSGGMVVARLVGPEALSRGAPADHFWGAEKSFQFSADFVT